MLKLFLFLMCAAFFGVVIFGIVLKVAFYATGAVLGIIFFGMIGAIYMAVRRER